MRHFHYTAVANETVGDGATDVRIRWLISQKTGAKSFAMRLFEIDPGGSTPFHHHDWEHEVFILEGKGAVKRDADSVAFTAGDVIFIPENEPHQFINTGQKICKFICVIPVIKDVKNAGT